MLRVVGAGVGRTGTHSLKLALERLLDAPCYHMYEVLQHLEHVPTWTAALRGRPVDWDFVFHGYAAAVDWPVAACWRELAEVYPDALVVLSTRDPEAWWRSASGTIFRGVDESRDPAQADWREMTGLMLEQFDPGWREHDAAVAAYRRHVEEVLATAPRDRLLVWQPQDGWEPLCAALGVDVPDEPFPHVNTSEEWAARRAAAAEEQAAAPALRPPRPGSARDMRRSPTS